MSAIDEAKAIVYGDREQDYGHPYDNHSRTALLWNAYLDAMPDSWDGRISPVDVCYFNVLQKIARDLHKEKHDNLVDMIGFIENAYRIRSGK